LASCEEWVLAKMKKTYFSAVELGRRMVILRQGSIRAQKKVGDSTRLWLLEVGPVDRLLFGSVMGRRVLWKAEVVPRQSTRSSEE